VNISQPKLRSEKFDDDDDDDNNNNNNNNCVSVLCGKCSEVLVVNLAVHIFTTRPYERCCSVTTTSTPYSTAGLLNKNKLLEFWPRLSIEENKGNTPSAFLY